MLVCMGSNADGQGLVHPLVVTKFFRKRYLAFFGREMGNKCKLSLISFSSLTLAVSSKLSC